MYILRAGGVMKPLHAIHVKPSVLVSVFVCICDLKICWSGFLKHNIWTRIIVNEFPTSFNDTVCKVYPYDVSRFEVHWFCYSFILLFLSFFLHFHFFAGKLEFFPNFGIVSSPVHRDDFAVLSCRFGAAAFVYILSGTHGRIICMTYRVKIYDPIAVLWVVIYNQVHA